MQTTMEQTTFDDLRIPLIVRRKLSIQRDAEARTIEQEDQDTQDDESPHIGVLLTFLLSALLYLQFSISFSASIPELLVQSRTVHVAVFLFFLTSILYRQTVQEANVNVTVLHLMPELIALSTIGLCYSGYAVAGFILLLIGKLIMAGVVVVHRAVLLFTGGHAVPKILLLDDEATTVTLV
jgi:uncharacterized membrane protein